MKATTIAVPQTGTLSAPMADIRASVRKSITAMSRISRALFAPAESMTVAAIGALAAFFCAVATDDQQLTATIAIITMPWFAAMLRQEGGEI